MALLISTYSKINPSPALPSRGKGVVQLGNYRQLKPICAILLLFSCNDEPLIPIDPTDAFPKGVFITNEGAFNNGNASVYFYDLTNNNIEENIFENANNRPLGDVLQSMVVQDNQAFLVVNNSSKIEIVDFNNFGAIKTIDNLTSPRYIQMVDHTTAYVSDLYSSNISVIDLDNTIEKSTIPFGSWSEEMAKIGNEIFVTQPSFFGKKSSNQLFVINTVSHEIIDSITVGFNPVSLELDLTNNLWVLCNGEMDDAAKLGGLYRINPTNKTVETEIPFTDDAVSFAPRLAMNPERNILYYLKLDVFALPISATTLPKTPLIKAQGRDVYALDVNPETGDIYVGDSGNFVQKGTVTVHDFNGNIIQTFMGGVGINGFYFN